MRPPSFLAPVMTTPSLLAPAIKTPSLIAPSLARLASTSARPSASTRAPIPPYPFPASATYKQSNTGLYGGTHIQFGNTVSSNLELKNRRAWRPNVHHKRLWSAALGRFLRVRVTARALRSIDKAGGLDGYLLGETPGRIRELGVAGWGLRWRVMQSEAVRARFREERRRLGLPDGEEVTEEAGEEAGEGEGKRVVP
ncbi:MAG: 39S ribosomal protein L24, mitochondrial [Thelocarpon impressellum]|nr:MAG: 39S ribosomal protein L24, mitochondrial [Thelocarpon impressellum]